MTKISDADMTDRIRCALRLKFDDRVRFCFLEEVGNTTGYRNAGWADGVVLHLWPSDGLKLWGFEIKASRTDWKKELSNLKKSENIARFCDRWIVVAPKGLVRDGELPAAWGLWEFDTETGIVRQADKGEERKPSKYLHRGFFASLIRRTQATMPAASYVALIHAASAREADVRTRGELQRAVRRAEKAEECIRHMEKAIVAAGGSWDQWRGEVVFLEQRGAA